MTHRDNGTVQRSILVVDDTPANLHLLVRLLRQQGYNARAAINGNLALSGAKTMPPDLILLDIMMPDMNGYEVCSLLKADEQTKDIPVIFISAIDDAMDKARAFAVGGVDYIPKPFQQAEVLARVENQLRLRSAQQQLQSQNLRLQNFSASLKQLHRLNTTAYNQLEALFSDYLQTGCEILGFPAGIISFIDREIYKIHSIQSNFEFLSPNLELNLKDTYCAEVVEKGKTVIYPLVSEIVALRDRALYQNWHIESYIGTPIWVNSSIYGTLNFCSPDRKARDANNAHAQEIIELMAQSLGKWIESYHAEMKRQRAEEETQLLLSVTQAISQAADFSMALDAALEQVCEASGWSYGEAWIPNPDESKLECSPAWYYNDDTQDDSQMLTKIQKFRKASRGLTFTKGVGLVGRVWEQAQPEYMQNPAAESGTAFVRYEIAQTCGVTLGLGVPILMPPVFSLGQEQPGRVLAVLIFFMFESSVPKSYPEDERLAELVSSVATQLGTVMQQKQAEAQLRALFAAMDDLVIIRNRAGRCLNVAPTNTTNLEKPAEELRGTTLHDILPQDTADLLLGCIQQTLDGKQTTRVEYSVTIGDREVWLDARLSPLSRDTAIFVARDISDRVQAESQLQQLAAELEERVKQRTTQLQEANQILRAVLDAVPGFVSWIGLDATKPSLIQGESPVPNLHYLGVNRLLADSLQLPPEHFIGQNLGFFTPDSSFTKFMNRFFLDERSSDSEVIRIEVNQEKHDYLVVAQKYQNNTAAVSVGIDITPRIQAEQKLQNAYQKLQLLSELTLKIRQSLDLQEILQIAVLEVQKLLNADRVLIVEIESQDYGVAIQEAVLPGLPKAENRYLDVPCTQENTEAFQQGQCIVVNDIEQFKGTPQELQNLQALQVKAKLVMPIFIQKRLWGALIVHQCYQPRQWHSDEIELLQQLADQIGIALSQAQLLNHLEELVAERTAKLRQANSSLQQEIDVRLQAEAALRDSERQLRLIADALPVLVAYVDIDEYYRFNNQAYEEWFGVPLNQITGRSMRDVLGENYYQSIRESVTLALSGDRVNFEIQAPEMNGISRYISITYIPDFGSQQQVKGFFSVAIDLSDRKAIEQMKDEFLSIASHELRTPLTSIRGSLGLLATGRLGELSSQGQRMLDIAVSNTDRLTRLINDILDLQRIESGRVKMVKKACNAVDLIVQAAEAMQAMADEARVTLHLQVEHQIFVGSVPPISLWVDPDQILQTLTNLISNAIKFSYPEGTIWIGVSQQSRLSDDTLSTASPASPEVLFQVVDQGRGIPKDKLESIFGRFQQVDASDSREKGGTGLGLPICREIIKQHGGKIWVESVPHQGSTFYFTLPAQPPDDSPEE
ncbi:GAF domain-containing protein [Lusitaniella coriacea LEGE 07157]|uniref:histidine kinase n=1 Tax=Lusitaniella coriacea LEGE 07157 TaxID=945747 RepID=A0A8J7DYF3_9CYAN|nr:GAF domain-containing protein [Lusitaniella coriacea]MBE9117661.1 GAF domain-containing protein [Lusitaniella coriacea LEGE 07157]